MRCVHTLPECCDIESFGLATVFAFNQRRAYSVHLNTTFLFAPNKVANNCVELSILLTDYCNLVCARLFSRNGTRAVVCEMAMRHPMISATCCGYSGCAKELHHRPKVPGNKLVVTNP